jgi:hypothetical protein
MLAMFGSDAGAGSFGGTGWRCCSELSGELDLIGVPNPEKKPSLVFVDLNLTIQVACINNGGNDGGLGTPFFVSVSPDPYQLQASDVDGTGHATVTVNVDLSGFETNDRCQNPNWSVVPDSAGVTAAFIVEHWHRCAGVDTDASGPDTVCIDENGAPTVVMKPIDVQTESCTLDPLDRNADGTVVHNQELTCQSQ